MNEKFVVVMTREELETLYDCLELYDVHKIMDEPEKRLIIRIQARLRHAIIQKGV